MTPRDDDTKRELIGLPAMIPLGPQPGESAAGVIGPVQRFSD